MKKYKSEKGAIPLIGVVIALIGLAFFAAVSNNPKLKEKIESLLSPPRSRASSFYSPKVLLLIYNPILESQENKKLTEYKAWNDPSSLSQTLVTDFSTASSGKVNYSIVETIELNDYPVKTDGFKYTDDEYLSCVASGGANCHSPDNANYNLMIDAVDACGKRNRGEIDELWIWGGPWFGYWESNLAGPGAFWYNSSPTEGTSCEKLLPIMGFNYERGESEALESYGHRFESTMIKVYGSWQPIETHNWNKFTLLDVDVPGRGGCGNAHNAVNAATNSGYDRTNSRIVPSSCEDFLNYPNLTGTFIDTNCGVWDCTNVGYLKWWYSHVPKADGAAVDGKLNNWWAYIVDPQGTIVDPGTFSGASATLNESEATFNFTYSGIENLYKVDLSTTSDMSTDVYVDFGTGGLSPIIVSNPEKWDKYTCDRTLYWRVSNSDRTAKSDIQTATVSCADVTPPSISITTPASGSSVSGAVTIDVSASDEKGIARVEFYVDDNLLSTDETDPYSYIWDTVVYPHNTNHTLLAKAYDTAGNVGSSEIVSVTVLDITAPVVVITNPLNGSRVKIGSVVTIAASVTDASTIPGVWFGVNNKLICTDVEAPYTCDWTVPRGFWHRIDVRTYDAAINTATQRIRVYAVK